MLSNHPNIMGGNGGGVSSTVIGGIGLFADGTSAAPSISFLSDPDSGLYRVAENVLGVAVAGSLYFRFTASGLLGRNTDSGINMDGVGAVSIFAAGTAQNITLTPSTTGWTATPKLLLNTAADSGALLQVGTDLLTTANGMIFGTDSRIYRCGTSILAIETTAGFQYRDAGTAYGSFSRSGDTFILDAIRSSLVLKSSDVTALTLDASQNSVFAGSVRAGNFTTAGAPPYAKGVIYFDTTLNKLRVGGATGFETITSV